MMTSSRPRNTSESFSSRRGHGNQLSISDPSHHVTEAIGTLYGDSDDDSGHEPRRDSRPLSFVASPYGGEQIQKLWLPQLHAEAPLTLQLDDPTRSEDRQNTTRPMSDMTSPVYLTASSGNGGPKTAQPFSSRRQGEKGGQPFDPFLPSLQPPSPLSPTLSLRDAQPDAQGTSQFPLTNIDNPNDIAQELSNLQALRRMSMDVGNSADPDLIPFQGLSLMAMPSIAPSGEDDEGDISRLLWVPAKVHPELAPDQFKNFLEKRVQSIKRRSGDSFLSADNQLSRGDAEGLRRKKSMLSRQVDSRNAGSDVGTIDGYDENVVADRHLQRKASRASVAHSAPELSINELVTDPGKVVQRLTLDTQRQSDGSERSSLDDDKPILPVPTMGLRRSTRTTYRKGGSVRSGDRITFSKRAAVVRQAQKDVDTDGDEPGSLALSAEPDNPTGHNIQRPHSEPLTLENFSRPARSAGRRNPLSAQDGIEVGSGPVEASTSASEGGVLPNVSKDSTSLTHDSAAVPDGGSSHGSLSTSIDPAPKQARLFPQRSSSQSSAHPDLTQARADPQQQPLVDGIQQQQPQQPPPRSNKRPSFGGSASSSTPVSLAAGTATGQTLSDIVHHPSALPGSGSTRTDSLTFIPTLSADDKKADRKSKDREDSEGGKSMGWKWFKSDDRDKKKKEREREREREREKDDSTKKPRPRPERMQLEKAYDGARLDVLQSSIDSSSPKGRESLLLERDSFEGKLYDEKKKDTGSRKVSESKKDKDGFFGSIFGGSRRKESKDAISSRGKQPIASPEPPLQLLRPDVDYPYTRFPIVEERAIYRMAHIKLANPRRDLRSQVLLSNFMYSYLAKVQAMHPQLNVPTSPHQKRQEDDRKRREQELQQQQQQYFEQQLSMQQQQQSQENAGQYDFEYHRQGSTQYGDVGHHTSDDGSVDYIDDAQIFEYDHGGHHNNDASHGLPSQHHRRHQSQEHANAFDDDGSNRAASGYYDYSHSDDHPHGDNDMW